MPDAIELTTTETPIACTLPEPDQRTRRDELATEVFSGVEETRELADGYAFRYPGSAAWATDLLEFITFERACCPFFTFELVFEPDQGPIWLRVRGPEGVKQFIREMAPDGQ